MFGWAEYLGHLTSSGTIANLEAEGIDCHDLYRAGGAHTGVAPITVEPDGTNRVVIIPGANNDMDPDRVAEAVGRQPTQVVIGVGVRCDGDGEETVVAPILEKLGYNPQRAKTNIGLGRKVIRDLTSAAPVAAPKEMVNA